MAHRGLFWLATPIWCAATVALLPALILVPDAKVLDQGTINSVETAIYLGWFAAAVSMGVVMGPVRSAFWRWIGIFAAMTAGLAVGAWIADDVHRAAHPPGGDDWGTMPVAVALYAVGGLLVLLGIVAAGITRWMWRALRR